MAGFCTLFSKLLPYHTIGLIIITGLLVIFFTINPYFSSRFASWWHRIAATFTWNPQRAFYPGGRPAMLVKLILWGLESGEYGGVFKGFYFQQQRSRHLKDEMLQVIMYSKKSLNHICWISCQYQRDTEPTRNRGKNRKSLEWYCWAERRRAEDDSSAHSWEYR